MVSVPIAGRLATVKKAQQQVSKRIREIQEQLKVVRKNPGTQPWLSFKRVQKVSELRGTSPTLQRALEKDLRELRTQMKDLKLKSKNLQKKKARQQANQASKDFKRRLDEVLKNAEKKGTLDEEDLGTLREDSEEVLEAFIAVLDGDPSLENIDTMLGELEVPALLGWDDESANYSKAWQSLRNAGTKLSEAAEKDFRRNPSVTNLDKKIEALSLSMQLGSDRPIWLGARPPGVKKLVNRNSHRVAIGDTLSRISQKYYGSPQYWDIIYLANPGKINDDPGKLRIGVELKIP